MAKPELAKCRLLLLDLDGVTICGRRSNPAEAEQVQLLHPGLPELFKDQNIGLILFTHRSFADAEHIRSVLQNLNLPVLHCICAREMMLSALKQLRFYELVVQGISKKFGVARVLEHYDTPASELVLIDDRPEILREVLSEGVGLALQAPFEQRDSEVVTFDFSEAIALLNKKTIRSFEVIRLKPVTRSNAELPIIASMPLSNASNAGLAARRFLRGVRQRVKKIRG